MKKLITTLASIPFTVLAQQFPEVSLYLYSLKNVVSAFICQVGYQQVLAMDLKTHACNFNCEKPIRIMRVGYRTWKTGITYQISIWQTGLKMPLATCLVTPEDTGVIQFFSLAEPVYAWPGISYYISRTYVSGGPNHSITDYIGWLSNKGGIAVYPIRAEEITLSNGFFSDDESPIESDSVSNITTHTLLPLIDFEYTLQFH